MTATRKVTSFDVFNEMCSRDSTNIHMSPLSEISQARKTKKGTQITIGFGGDIVAGILNQEFVGGLLIVDKKEYEAVRKELEARP